MLFSETITSDPLPEQRNPGLICNINGFYSISLLFVVLAVCGLFFALCLELSQVRLSTESLGVSLRLIQHLLSHEACDILLQHGDAVARDLHSGARILILFRQLCLIDIGQLNFLTLSKLYDLSPFRVYLASLERETGVRDGELLFAYFDGVFGPIDMLGRQAGRDTALVNDNPVGKILDVVGTVLSFGRVSWVLGVCCSRRSHRDEDVGEENQLHSRCDC